MTDASERLGDVSAAALHDLVTTVVASRWAGEWTTDRPPPSPDGSTDVRFDGEAGRRLVRVARRPASRPVGAPEVAEFAAFAGRSGFDAGAFVSTGGFADAAGAVDAPDVRLVGPRRILDWADEAGVALRADESVGTPGGANDDADGDGRIPPSVERVIDRYGAYWPGGLTERARAVVTVVVDAAAFEFRVSAGDASTEIRCRLDGSVPVRIRFTATSFLVFVRDDDGAYERALALTVHRENRPPTGQLVDAADRAVAGAVRLP